MIDVKTASFDDLMAEAVEVLGLEVSADITVDSLRIVVDGAQGGVDKPTAAVLEDDNVSEDIVIRGQAKDLGIKGWHNTGIAKLKVKITDALDEAEIDPEKLRVMKAEEGRKPENRKLVIFHNQDGADGTGDVKINVNGFRYRIKREEEVSLPQEALNVINDAIITSFYRDEVTGEIRERNQRRFNYSVV